MYLNDIRNSLDTHIKILALTITMWEYSEYSILSDWISHTKCLWYPSKYIYRNDIGTKIAFKHKMCMYWCFHWNTVIYPKFVLYRKFKQFYENLKNLFETSFQINQNLANNSYMLHLSLDHILTFFKCFIYYLM